MATACLLPYAPAIFGSLPEFEVALESKPVVEASVIEAAAVFQKHGLAESVGLSMLHRHFPLEEGEILVESPVGSTSFIRPEHSALPVKADLQPYMFRLVETAEGFVLAPLEYAPAHIIDSEKLAALVCNSRFVNEIGALIRKHKVSEITQSALAAPCTVPCVQVSRLS
jgi:hypothetical protein